MSRHGASKRKLMRRGMKRKDDSGLSLQLKQTEEEAEHLERDRRRSSHLGSQVQRRAVSEEDEDDFKRDSHNAGFRKKQKVEEALRTAEEHRSALEDMCKMKDVEMDRIAKQLSEERKRSAELAALAESLRESTVGRPISVSIGDPVEKEGHEHKDIDAEFRRHFWTPNALAGTAASHDGVEAHDPLLDSARMP